MNDKILNSWLVAPALLGATLVLSSNHAGAAASDEVDRSAPIQADTGTQLLVAQAAPQTAPTAVTSLDEIQRYGKGINSGSNRMGQVTSVSQLRDVRPTDWSFQALQSLVERYGCIAGYPDGTFRGNRPLSRFEFAAGLNACLDRINELIAAATTSTITRADLSTLQRLQEEFAAELATLRGRVDALEARTAELEANQFSTTTRLVGEIAFAVADAFGDNDNTQTVLQNKIRLQLVTSFTGKDKLFTRLTTGNLGNSFADELGTNEGRFAHDGIGDGVFRVDRLHYVFPVTNDLQATVMASLGGHHFYADTFNPGLEAGGGANNAISRFAERNPIYRFGLGGQGLGLRFKLSKQFELSAGYLAPRGGNNPSEEAGLFNGNYSAMGQLVFKPSNSFKIGFTYLNGYDVDTGSFRFGGTGTGLGNLAPPALDALGVQARPPVSSNSYGVQTFFRFGPKFSLRAWGGLTKARLIDLGDADIWTYSLVAAFPDLGKNGNLGAIVVGAEPYLTDLDVSGSDKFDDDIPWHVEAFYRYQLTDNISITPGVIWLTAPNQNNDSDDIWIGTIRTTFRF